MSSPGGGTLEEDQDEEVDFYDCQESLEPPDQRREENKNQETQQPARGKEEDTFQRDTQTESNTGHLEKEQSQIGGGLLEKEQSQTRDGHLEKEQSQIGGGLLEKEQSQTRDGHLEKEQSQIGGGLLEKEQSQTRDGHLEKEQSQIGGGLLEKEQSQTRDGHLEKEQSKTREGHLVKEQSKTQGGLLEKEQTKTGEGLLEKEQSQIGEGQQEHSDRQDGGTELEQECRGEEFDDEYLREVEQELTLEEKESRRQQSFILKEQGNSQFKAGDWLEAEQSYTAALGLCPVCFSQERAVLFSNRAAARLHLDLKDQAIADCSRAIELNPNYVRALLRRAELHEQTEKLDEALEDYRRVLDNDPNHIGARQACMRLPQQIHDRNEKLKEEMIGKLKDLGNMILRPFGLSTNNFQVNQDANTGGYSINFVQNPNSSNR